MINSNQIKCVMKVLYDVGLKPIFHCKAQTGSVYIKFGCKIGGSLRIGNHQQRSRYAYRWNLREDVKHIQHRQKLDHMCHYYPFSEFETMVGDMLKEFKNRKELEDTGKESIINILSKGVWHEHITT